MIGVGLFFPKKNVWILGILWPLGFSNDCSDGWIPRFFDRNQFKVGLYYRTNMGRFFWPGKVVVSSANNCCLELRNCCVKHERVKLNQGMMFATKTVISSEKLWSWPWTLGLKLIIEKNWSSRGIWIVHDDLLRWLWCLLMLIGFPTARLFRSHFSDVQCFGRVKCSGNKRIPINKGG